MNFPSHCLETNVRWQLYKRLELIPDSTPNPKISPTALTTGVGWLWRSLISLLIAELVAEEREDEYLERCWALNLASDRNRFYHSLRQLLILMD